MVIFALFGMGIFAACLIASIYYGVGSVPLGWDFDSNKKIVGDWVGLSFYISNDIFAWAVMS